RPRRRSAQPRPADTAVRNHAVMSPYVPGAESSARAVRGGRDRVTLDVIGSALLSIAEEMGVALIKSSYSSNIKERQDCSTAVFTASGEVIAQAEHIPMHLGSLQGVVGEVLRRYPVAALRPGDVFIANDPYSGGGTHL